MTEKEWIEEMDKAQLRLTYLSKFVKCDDCGNMVSQDELGHDEHWSTLCKNCVVDI